LLDALERCDLRYWPKGIFRRSFFRDYARAIGLSVAETCADFVRLFPDDDRSAVSEPAVTPVETTEQASDVRLVLDAAWQGPRGSFLPRLAAAMIDGAVVVAVSAGLAWLSGIAWPVVTSIVALAYFSFATVLFGQSPAQWLLASQLSLLEALKPSPGQEPETRTWTSDAHRVGPAPASRLRVRIKVPQ
jgi:hypothetical protein